MSIEVYSDGTRITGIESVIGYDLQNPMEYWLDGLDKPVSILTELWEFNNKFASVYESASSLIEDQNDFTGDTYYMSPEHMKRYIDKHFHVLPFIKGEHGISWYKMGAGRNWDYGTAGFFLLPKSEWPAADANRFACDCNNLMECMTAWANGDEYATYEFYLKNGSLDYESCFGFYGRDDALADACIDGYDYLGEFSADDEKAIFGALMAKYPDKFQYIEHVEHVPEQVKIIPAHDEVWTEFVHVA